MFSPHPSSTSHRSEDVAKSLVEKYTTDFPIHHPLLPQSPLPPVLETVLLIGSRGGIGANLLSQLLTRHDTCKVYALNRRHDDGRTSQKRQRDEFELQGLNPSLAESQKLVLLEGKTSDATLGLSRDIFHHVRPFFLLYQRLRSIRGTHQTTQISKSVTAIIVNGWRVEFRSRLPAFEDLIAGIRNLINIALRSPQSQPPYFLFCSSLASLQGEPRVAPLDSAGCSSLY